MILVKNTLLTLMSLYFELLLQTFDALCCVVGMYLMVVVMWHKFTKVLALFQRYRN